MNQESWPGIQSRETQVYVHNGISHNNKNVKTIQTSINNSDVDKYIVAFIYHVCG